MFENPNAKDSIFIAFLHQTSPSGFSFKDSVEFSFKVSPPSNFAFVLPEPRYTTISDLELNKKFNWTLAIALFFLLGLLQLLFNRKKKQRAIVKRTIQETVRVPIEQNSINDINKGPYYLPLIDNAHQHHQMYENTEIRDMVIALNRRRDVEINKIDNHKTIHATIKRAGVLKVVYQPSYYAPKYLLLIKADNSRNHHYHFILDIVKHLEKQVQITVFIYDYSIHHLVELKANKVYQLSDLKNSYHNHQFVLWGDGYDLMDSSTEDIHHTIKRELNVWDNKILLTPVHPLLWNRNEVKLANYFYIDSSDIKGVLRLNTYYQFEQYENIETKIDILNKQLHSMVAFPNWEQFENKLRVTESEDDKRNLYEYYIQRINWYYSEDEYQLICCCALYENLYWDVTKALAIELYGERFFTDELVYNLCHLPWFIKGKIPAVFREILIQDIDADKKNHQGNSIRDVALEVYEKIISQSTARYMDSFACNNMHLQVAEIFDNQQKELPESLRKYKEELGNSTNSVYDRRTRHDEKGELLNMWTRKLKGR
ncbi:MAG: hypothetical protein IPJ31_06920 [Bacteroidetes bacterium]|nr:hypothetical protein [Bacteroidota bacterium]